MIIYYRNLNSKIGSEKQSAAIINTGKRKQTPNATLKLELIEAK